MNYIMGAIDLVLSIALIGVTVYVLIVAAFVVMSIGMGVLNWLYHQVKGD